MNYKIVSDDSELISKASNIFTSLNMKESIHIQEVDFWLIDANNLNKNSILSYKNKNEYSKLLFIVHSDEQIKTCLENNFLFYVTSSFTNLELSYWCKYFQSLEKTYSVKLEDNIVFNSNKKQLIKDDIDIDLTLQEFALLNAINNDDFIKTENLMTILELSTTSSVRTIINRIRKKVSNDIIVHKRHYGYKLNKLEIQNKNDEQNNSHIKELEEQNSLMQEIVDSSPIFIVTFVHKKLYCINKSFREFLGVEIIKELWDETKGDFFQLIKHNINEKELLKKELFSTGVHKVELLNFKSDETTIFNIKTYYFENLDKHLLIFEKI